MKLLEGGETPSLVSEENSRTDKVENVQWKYLCQLFWFKARLYCSNENNGKHKPTEKAIDYLLLF